MNFGPINQAFGANRLNVLITRAKQEINVVTSVRSTEFKLTDNRGVKAVRDYLVYIDAESRKRFESGMSALEAAKEIDLDLFSTWGDEERIAVNVNSLYREYKGEEKREEITLLFQQMAELSGIDE